MTFPFRRVRFVLMGMVLMPAMLIMCPFGPEPWRFMGPIVRARTWVGTNDIDYATEAMTVLTDGNEAIRVCLGCQCLGGHACG